MGPGFRCLLKLSLLALLAMNGCRAPRERSGSFSTAPIVVDRFSVNAEVVDGQFANGLNDSDDPFWYRVTVPGHPTLQLSEDVLTRCTVCWNSTDEETEIRFKGRFLDGVAILAAVGATHVRLDADVRPTIIGLSTPVAQLPWLLTLNDGWLSVNNVRLCELPKVGAATDADLSATISGTPAGGIDEQGFGDAIQARVVLDVHDDGTELIGDLVLPPDGLDVVGAVVCLFGSGFREVDFAWVEGWPRTLADRGFVALSPHYRCTSSGAGYEDTLEDVYQSIKWLQDSAGDYGIPNDDVSVLGYSAGAQLAMLTAYADAVDLGLSTDLSLDYPVRRVVALAAAPLLSAPATPIDRADMRMRAMSEWIGGWQPDLFYRLSPGAWLRPGTPPTLLIHHRGDGVMPIELVELFACECDAREVRCRFVRIEDELEPIRAHYFLRRPEGTVAISEVWQWLASRQ
jgi:acetyl esterase/lipase